MRPRGFQATVKAFHHPVGLRLVSRCVVKSDSEGGSQGRPEKGGELGPPVGRQVVRDTEPGDPVQHQSLGAVLVDLTGTTSGHLEYLSIIVNR